MCDMYNSPVNYNETSEDQSLWTSQDSIEDKIILETEITLKTGPNITMKIHEESRPNSVMNESEEDTKKQGVIKVLNEDSESDYYESRRSPKKVRFGGESFKLRTPESDSSLQAEDDNDESTIKITVTDAISIRTRKSLIPIRISSLPSTPKKTVVYQNIPTKQYKSAPNLTDNSRIPLKKKQFHKVQSESNLSPEKAQDQTRISSKPRILKQSRAEGVLSPIPIHNEIEVFHNLTRSPDRSRDSSPKPEDASKNAPAFNSFTVCNENEVRLEPERSSESEKNVQSLMSKSTESSNSVKKASLQQSLSSLTSDDEIWSKSEALDSLVKMLREPGTCETLEPGPAALLFEALFACHHRERLHTLADDALTTLIQGIRQEVLEQCLQRVSVSICKMGVPSGIRCALVIMKKLPPRKLQAEILAKGFSHRTREGALQILMACARLYPRVDVEVAKIAEFAAQALRDRRRRVRHASLETLAATAQISSTHEVLSIVEATVKDYQAFDEIVQVVRARLSRKQLPTVDLNGSIRYSSPTEKSESDWIAGAVPSRSTNTTSSPLSSASSSTQSVNYWMHNSRHESFEDDAFDDSSKIWAVDANGYIKNGKSNKVLRGNSLRPVYILQPDIVSIENGKNGRGHRKYDRGRSFSPPKPYRAQLKPGLVEHNNHSSSFNDINKHFGSSEFNSRLHYPEPGTSFRPHDFRKSFSSDQLYFNNRLPSKHESLSSRSSSTSTGSSTKSGFWSKDFRSAIPVPISETKLKIRHSTSSIVSSGGPLIAKRSVFSPQQTPSSSKVRNTNVQDNDSVSRLSLAPPPKSSGSDSSSGYFTPSPPEKHPPAFIKMDTEERPSSADNNNLVDCVDSSAHKSVSDGSLSGPDNQEEIPSTETNDYLGETIHDNYPSVESLNLNDNPETPEKRPPSRASEPLPGTIDVERKSKSVVDLPNFLPKIDLASRKIINSAPPRNDDSIINNNNPVDTCDNLQLPSMDYAIEQEIVTSNKVTVSKSKLERRFSRNSSRKSIRTTPRTVLDPTSRPPSKPKDLLQQVLHQMENPNSWESTVDGLQGLSKLARQHPEVVEHQIHHVCLSLAKQIKNLRSQVSRVACNTAAELFLSCKKGLEMEFEEIACPLLQRTADTNRFLRADANAALDVMCEQLPVHRVIPVVTSRGCGHQNAIVRAAAVRMLGDLVQGLGAERIFQMPKDLKDKVLLAGANALADGNSEARSQGKCLLGYLIKHPNFQRSLHEAVPQNLLMHISKSLASIKT